MREREGVTGRSGAETAVEAAGLTRTFGDFTAVDHVSFRVAEGEIFGFLGPNGAGKTTTIRMLTGLLPPSEGRGRVAGLDVASERDRVRRVIGYMSQLFSLYGDLTVEENITFFARMYGLSGPRQEARRAWALEMAGLEAHRDRLTRDLPLGFKQRLALGCAVLHEPPILFLDEPTSGVDPTSRRRFWDLIDDLAGEGTTIFVTTHYMQEAEYCDRLALMNRGRIVALDTPGALREAMDEPLFEVDVDDSPRAVEALAGAPGVVEASMFGRKVHVTLEDRRSARRRIPELLEASGVAVHGLEPVEPSLEDVFVSLVRAAGGAPAD